MSDPFYQITAEKMWGSSIDPVVINRVQLDKQIIDGLRLYKNLNKKPSWIKWADFLIPVLVLTGVGIAAYAAAGTPAAASGAIAGSGELISSVGITEISAAGLPKTAAGTFATVQKGAGYISSVGTVYKKATGKDDADKLISTADLLQSGNLTEAGTKAAEYLLEQRGAKLDEQGKKALQQRVKDEEQMYAAYLRQQAQTMKDESGQNLPVAKKETLKIETIIALATPFILLLASK